MSSNTQYPVTAALEDHVFQLRREFGIEARLPAVDHIVEAVGVVEHQGMEPGAYSVTLEQYAEVARDLIDIIIAQS